jgi:hypothetical protein
MWRLCCCTPAVLKYRFRQFIGISSRYGYRGWQPGEIVAQYNTGDPAYPANSWLTAGGVPSGPPSVVIGDFVLFRASATEARLYRVTTTTTTPSPPQTLVGFRDMSGNAHNRSDGLQLPRFRTTLPANTAIAAGTIYITAGNAWLATVDLNTTASPTPPAIDARWLNLGAWGGFVGGGYWHGSTLADSVVGRYAYAEEQTVIGVITEKRPSGVVGAPWEQVGEFACTHRRKYQCRRANAVTAREVLVDLESDSTVFDLPVPDAFGATTFDIGPLHWYPFAPIKLASYTQNTSGMSLTGSPRLVSLPQGFFAPGTPQQATFDQRYTLTVSQSVTHSGDELEGNFTVPGVGVQVATWAGVCRHPDPFATPWENRTTFGPCLPGGSRICQTSASSIYIGAVNGSILEIESNCHSTLNGVPQLPGTFSLGNGETWCPDPTKPCATP